MSSHGILLVNLGTPEKPDTKHVRLFLREFLSDPYVIDIPAPLRYLLLYAFILPFRPKKSAAAYQKIWMEKGSPLKIYSKGLVEDIKHNLELRGDNKPHVALAMRYGTPSLKQVIYELTNKGYKRITVLPMFPQYSLATSESVIQKVKSIFKEINPGATLSFIKEFYNHPGYILPQAQIIQSTLDSNPKLEGLLLSYHGLPVRQIKKVEANSRVCDQTKACRAIDINNKRCYRAQCYATSKLLTAQLTINPQQVHTCFQSRLGKNPWIGPATTDMLKKLRTQGIKHIAVACPSFLTDCLETLEEIGIAAKQDWLEMGGETLTLIPCLNQNSAWVDGILEILGIQKP